MVSRRPGFSSPQKRNRDSCLNSRTGFAWIGENEVAWRFPLAFQIVFALTIFASILNLPESPRWLVMQGRDQDAIEVLTALNERPRDDPFIKNEFEAVKQTVLEMSKGSYKSLFQMSEYREFHRVALAYVNQMFQQISGINLIVRRPFMIIRSMDLTEPHRPTMPPPSTKSLSE